jgi:2,4-dienoyl-CoA reductase-like NADH-dependent reductase (Old Yellow Enzyme family)
MLEVAGSVTRLTDSLRNYPLFRPMRINHLELPNRIVMAPMGVGRSPGGVP